MNTLRDLLNGNRLPALFIGSGISKRYLKDMPLWDELLINICSRINISPTQYYAYKQKIDVDDMQLPKLASLIEDKIVKAVIEGEYIIENDLSIEYQKYISESVSFLKLLIANELSKLELKTDEKTISELESLKNAVLNCNNIFTTNYDSFFQKYVISDDYMTIYEKQSDLYFNETFGIGEMYMFHGTINDPGNIVINERDYLNYFDNMNIFVSKLYNTLLNRPMIFLGYGMSDRNVLKILESFIKHFPFETVEKISKNLIFIEYKESEQELVFSEKSFQVGEKQIKMKNFATDNYKKIYDTIVEVKQGISAREIKRYESVIYDIVKNHERDGEKVFLASSLDIDRIDSNKMVLAITPKNDDNLPLKGLIGEDTVKFIEHALFERKDILFNDIATTWVDKKLVANKYFPIYYIKDNISDELQVGERFEANLKHMDERFSSIRTTAYSISVDNIMAYERDFRDMINNVPKDMKEKYFEHAVYLVIRNKIKVDDLRRFLQVAFKKNKEYIQKTNFKKAVCYLPKLG